MITSASAAVDRMTARFAAGGGPLAKLEIQRDQLTIDLEEADRRLSTLTAAAAGEARDKALAGAVERRKALRSSLDQLDIQIAKEFPQFFELTRPKPLTVGQVQKLLNSDEALLLVLVLDDASYVWAVNRETSTWSRTTALSAETLAGKLAILRASMGVGGARGSVSDDISRAAVMVGSSRPAPRPSQFQGAVAYELYKELIAPVEAVLAGKKVVLTNVSGPLTSIPLGLLLTSEIAPGQPLTDAAWLSDRYALAELPSVSSLRALRCLLITRRADAHPGCELVAVSPNHSVRKAAAFELVGFGAPVLGGRLPDGNEAPPTPADIMKTPGAIPAKLRRLSELPQAKAELESLARQFGARAVVATGAKATEQAVKASRDLPEARFIVFSTHGLLATEIGDNVEPGLVLTPPPENSAVDDNDGLLTASEAAQLRLSADLVVLSACNTAAPDGKPGAEGLSGLARAFFFAGARSMLVSHWAVSDEATSRLMQGTFAALSGKEPAQRAVALQTAMKALRKSENGRFADPRYWAPFSLVGEPSQ